MSNGSTQMQQRPSAVAKSSAIRPSATNLTPPVESGASPDAIVSGAANLLGHEPRFRALPTPDRAEIASAKHTAIFHFGKVDGGRLAHGSARTPMTGTEGKADQTQSAGRPNGRRVSGRRRCPKENLTLYAAKATFWIHRSDNSYASIAPRPALMGRESACSGKISSCW